jgi:hypothetical protein
VPEDLDTLRETFDATARAAAEYYALARHCENTGHPRSTIDQWSGVCFCGAVQLPRSGWPPTEQELTQ